MIFSPLMRLSGHSRNQETKWCFKSYNHRKAVAGAHIPSRFANDGRCRHDVDAVDLSQVRTGHTRQSFTQVELRLISFLLLEPLLAELLIALGPCPGSR